MPDADKTVIAQDGNIYVAPFGTALPETPTETLNAAFTELGYVTDDGVTFSAEPTTEDINAWQSATPIRRLVTARALSAAWQGQEWSKDSFALAFGGGAWTEPEAGVYRYDPPADRDALADFSLVLDWADGDRNYRLVILRGNVTDAVETNLIRTGTANLNVTFSALAPDNADRAWYLLTDDPAFDIAT